MYRCESSGRYDGLFPCEESIRLRVDKSLQLWSTEMLSSVLTVRLLAEGFAALEAQSTSGQTDNTVHNSEPTKGGLYRP